MARDHVRRMMRSGIAPERTHRAAVAPEAGSNFNLGAYSTPAAPTTTTMTSPARVLLRSHIFHGNFDRALGGQVRHLHGNAAKPVFHWEVSPTATPRVFILVSKQPTSLFSGPIGPRGSIVCR